MSVMNGFFIRGSFIGGINPTPQTSAYDTITIYGESNIDKVHLRNNILTETEINAIDYTEQTSWTPNTLLLAEFRNNLSAGNVTGLTSDATHWEIQRRSGTETTFTVLATVPITQTEYIDYTIGSRERCIYRIFALNEDERSQPLQTETVLADFYLWSLVDDTTGEVFIFDLNIDSGSHTSNTGFTVYNDVYSQKPSVSYSQLDYLSGTISGMAGTVNCTDGRHIAPKSYLENFRSFINNKRTKLLKSRNGDVWRVNTNNFRLSYIDNINNTREDFQPAIISFDYVETSDIIVGGSN